MKSLALFVVLSLILELALSSSKVRYDNYAVYRVNFQNKQQRDVWKNIMDKEKYDIWYESSEQMDVMINPAELTRFNQLSHLTGIQVQPFIKNVQDLIDSEQPMVHSSEFNWKRYYNLTEIETWLDGILLQHNEVTEGFVIGLSFEGRPIRGLKISHQADRPAIFIESTIHAREWITVATATWLINELLNSQEASVRELANNYDWYIIPVLNVDGFVYTHTKNRMWRKTRQPQANSSCLGVDGNRNFDSHWMANGGASDDPCEDRFAGPKAFSEPETKALSEFVLGLKDKVKIYLAFHSYSQYLLSPYGHTATEFPENHKDLMEIGEAFTQAIKSLIYGTEYTHGSTASLMYVASGSSVDWAFNEVDIKIAYTIEFRDRGRYGQVLPATHILPNCEELLAGLIALVDKAHSLNYI